MTEHNRISGLTPSVSDTGSWAVEYSEQDRMLTITALDYHAGPLKLPLEDVLKLAGEGARLAAGSQDEEPLVGISRKEKSLYIAVPEGWSGLLRISRKELYRYGKKMGKRGRARK